MSDKAISLMGLMRKAGAIELGEDNTAAAVSGGKARLVLVAADASENAAHRAHTLVQERSALLVPLPYTKAAIAEGLGAAGCAMLAVTDMGFADALMKLLAGADSEKYGELAAQTAERLAKADRRRAQKQASQRNKRIGKRRTNI